MWEYLEYGLDAIMEASRLIIHYIMQLKIWESQF